jgi:hypothetical protein
MTSNETISDSGEARRQIYMKDEIWAPLSRRAVELDMSVSELLQRLSVGELKSKKSIAAKFPRTLRRLGARA